MGVQYSRAALLDIEEQYRSLGPAAEGMMDEQLSAIAEEGAEGVRQGIETASTPYGLSQGRGGRSDPARGSMLADVKVRKIPIADPTVRIWEFGWIENFEKYYTFQEGGFTHWVSHKLIPGMFALRDASTAARVRMKTVGPTIIKALYKLAP